MLSLIGRMAVRAAPHARNAVGSIASRVASGARGFARAVGSGVAAVGGYIGRALMGRNSGPDGGGNQNDPGANAFVDTSTTESRGTQLAVSGSQPSPVGGLGNEQPRNNQDGFASAAVLALLRSIDSGIKNLREQIQINAATAASAMNNQKDKKTPLLYRAPNTMGFGVGMLGLIAGSVLLSGRVRGETPENNNQTPSETQPQVTPQPRVNPDIAGPANENTQQLEEGLGMAPAPNPSALQQPPTVENRQPFRNDLSQLNNLLEETREIQREHASRSRNPRQNSLTARLVASAENSLNALRQEYDRGNSDQEQISALRDEFMRNIRAARQSLNITVTPEPQTPEIPQDATPAAPDATPGPQSSVEDGLVNVVANRDIDLTTDSLGESKNSYIDYMVAAMSNTSKIAVASESASLTLKDIISGSEDNVSRKLNAIQVNNPMSQGGGAPVIINAGGGDARPAVVPVPAQQNTPAPSPGTGGILIGYRSHPMLVNEPRSPAAISHP